VVAAHDVVDVVAQAEQADERHERD